jgi:hypothetical protein
MGEQCTFDLCNLLAVNSHQVAVSKLYSKARKEDAEHITIPSTEALSVLVNEAHLLEKATDGCTQLIHALWQLPTDRSDAGPMVSLPSYSEIKLPRQLVSIRWCLLIILESLANPNLSTASTSAEAGNKVGEVCKGKGNSSQQEKAITESLG